MTTNNSAEHSADVVNTSTPGSNTEIVLDSEILKRATLTLRAIRNPERKRILQAIGEKGSVTVNEICRVLGMPQPVVSLNLSILRKAKVVIDNRKGKNIYYSIDTNRLTQVMFAASQLSWLDTNIKTNDPQTPTSSTPEATSDFSSEEEGD